MSSKLTSVNLHLLFCVHTVAMDNVDSRHDYEQLLRAYAAVCNQAILRNKNRFPFKQILGALQLSESGKMVSVNVTNASDNYFFKIDSSGVSCAAEDTDLYDGHWDVDEDYLSEVTKNPDMYINNPAKLNWDWLYSG